jgi:hypothetical protein
MKNASVPVKRCLSACSHSSGIGVTGEGKLLRARKAKDLTMSQSQAGKHMRKALGVAISAAAFTLGITTAVPAMAATGSARPAVVQPAAASVQASKPFQIKAGKPFAVTSTVRGVRKGDRLALEAYSSYSKSRKPSWHVVGSWPMKAGQTRFRGIARASDPGLFTLRVQFLRNRKLLPNSQSNAFQLKVLSFKLPKLPKPSRAGKASVVPGTVAAAPDVPVSSWTDVECANPLTVAHGVIVPSPITEGLSGQGEVAQVIWARDALPGGRYGAWYVAGVHAQYITPPQPDQFQIVEDADAESVLSNQLAETTLDYSAATSDEFHQFAWDLALQQADGSWAWINPSAWYTPASYVQWDTAQTGTFQSANCETYYTAGHA